MLEIMKFGKSTGEEDERQEGGDHSRGGDRTSGNAHHWGKMNIGITDSVLLSPFR